MRSARSKFKQRCWRFLWALLPALLVGCAQLPAQHTHDAASPEPLARMSVPIPATDQDVNAQLLAGEFALSGNDLEAAAQAYARAAMLSTDPEVASRAVGLAIAVHDAAGATRAIGRWESLGASPASLAEARARLALGRGDTDTARQQLDILTTSGDKDAWRVLGRILLGARDSAQAGNLLESLAIPARLPDDDKAWLAMSEIGEKFGRHAYARTIADAALKRFHTADTYAWAGQLAFHAGKRAQARRLFVKAIALAPDEARLRLAYAGILSNTGDNKAAVKVLSRGRQNAQTFAARAGYAARAKDKRELARIYAELQKAPRKIREQSDFLLGQLAEMAGKRKQALAWYTKVDLDDDHRFDADLRSAILLHQQGERERAHSRAQQLQTEYADQAEPLRRALQVDAEMYMQDEQYAQAVPIYTRALQLAPTNTELLYGRGLAYAESGKIDAAVSDLKHLLTLKPDDIDAANALGYTLADNDRNLDEAHNLIERARSARPNDPAIDDSWGWLQYRLGHLQQAEQALRMSWSERKDADVGAHLAEVLWKRGQSAEARKVLAEAWRLDPHNATLETLKKKITP